ncbi:hypothetical protein [Pelagicoccus albus]|uniref:Uncharacterized protein n=1 Tax=Pelagicoccus albus TaxID=415222 RepID=A0A7X1B681_9BACT|nr:hypothetical protein [Pelagicoccus albus]MBC2606287.1 hypothetical protein [Pelagicoccus albus]
MEDFEDICTWRAESLSGGREADWFPAVISLGSYPIGDDGGYVGKGLYSVRNSGGRVLYKRAKLERLQFDFYGVSLRVNALGKPIRIAVRTRKDSTNLVNLSAFREVDGMGWRDVFIELEGGRFAGLVIECKGSGEFLIDDLIGIGVGGDRIGVSIRKSSFMFWEKSDIRKTFRVSNYSDLGINLDVRIAITPVGRDAEVTENRTLILGPHSSEDLVFIYADLSAGPYFLELEVSSLKSSVSVLDYLLVSRSDAVAVRSAGPILFGVQCLATWEVGSETDEHLAWLRYLGVDLVRLICSGHWFEPTRRERPQAFLGRLFNKLESAGLDVSVLYTTRVPSWTRYTRGHGMPPERWGGFKAHLKRLSSYLSLYSNVKYLEVWNEPNLAYFYRGTYEAYIEMLSLFHRVFDSENSEVKIVSGGIVGAHENAIPAFGERIFVDGNFDLFGYHSHGSLSALKRDIDSFHHERKAKTRLANTESGLRSLGTKDGAIRQARDLVRKLVYTMSEENVEFFIWFTLQDFWDFDLNSDDSFGLVSVFNSPKPSFASYRNLICLMSGKSFYEYSITDSGLSVYRFSGGGPDELWVVWLDEDRDTRNSALLEIKGGEGVRLEDMFGRDAPVLSREGSRFIRIGRAPFYMIGDRIELESSVGLLSELENSDLRN